MPGWQRVVIVCCVGSRVTCSERARDSPHSPGRTRTRREHRRCPTRRCSGRGLNTARRPRRGSAARRRERAPRCHRRRRSHPPQGRRHPRQRRQPRQPRLLQPHARPRLQPPSARRRPRLHCRPQPMAAQAERPPNSLQPPLPPARPPRARPQQPASAWPLPEQQLHPPALLRRWVSFLRSPARPPPPSPQRWASGQAQRAGRLAPARQSRCSKGSRRLRTRRRPLRATRRPLRCWPPAPLRRLPLLPATCP